MKLLSSLTVATAAVLFAAGTTSAQGVYIGNGTLTSVKPGQQFTFRLMRPNAPSYSHQYELGVTVGFQACHRGVNGCSHDLSQGLGKVILPTAGFDPKVAFHDANLVGLYQKFTVTIPQDAKKGAALLGVRRETTSTTARTMRPLAENMYLDLTVI